MALLRRRSDKVALLRSVPMFEALSKKDLDAIARHADEISVPAGKKLAVQGQLGQEFFLIVEGRAVVRRNRRKIASLGNGDFFGEMSLLDGQPRTADVVAETDSVLLVMHRRDFSSVLDEVPGLARKLLAGMSRRLRAADAKLVT